MCVRTQNARWGGRADGRGRGNSRRVGQWEAAAAAATERRSEPEQRRKTNSTATTTECCCTTRVFTVTVAAKRFVTIGESGLFCFDCHQKSPQTWRLLNSFCIDVCPLCPENGMNVYRSVINLPLITREGR